MSFAFEQRLLAADIFGGETSFFNFKGYSKINTIPGAILSICSVLVSLYFAVVTFVQMVNNEEVQVKDFTLYDSDTQMMDSEYNLADSGIDLAIGFNVGTTPFSIPPEDLLSIEANMVLIDNLNKITKEPIEMGKCADGNYDFDKIKPFLRTVQEPAACFKDKSKINVFGMSDS